MTEMRRRLSGTTKQVISVGGGVVLNAIAAIGLMFRSDDHVAALMLWATAVAVGWTLGVLASPYTQKESAQFDGAGKVLGGVVAGFLVAKLDKAFEAAFDQGLILTSSMFVAVCAFVISVLGTALGVYVVRAYVE